MEFHEIDSKGKLWIERVATLPTWTANDIGRLVYAIDDDTFYKGGATEWQQFGSSLTNFAGGIRPTFFEYSSTSAINLRSARYYHYGTTEQIVKWNVTLTKTFSPLTPSTWQYLYIDDSALTDDTVDNTKLINNATEPIWQDTKLGYYNGLDLCIGAFYINSSGQIRKFYQRSDLILWDSQDKVYGATYGSYPGTGWSTQVTFLLPSFSNSPDATFEVNPPNSVAWGYQAFWRPGDSTGTGFHVGRGHGTSGGDDHYLNTLIDMPVFTDTAKQIDIKVSYASGNALMSVFQNGYYLPKGIV